MTSVCVLSKVKSLVAELRHALPNLVFKDISTPCSVESINELIHSEIIIADFDLIGPHLYDLKNTKWIQGTWAGLDGLFPFLKPTPPPCLITRFSGKYFRQIMLEYVLAHIVNYERNFYFNYDNQKTKIWDNSETRRFRIIPELTFGILGMGQIGNTIGIGLHNLGGSVLGFGRNPREMDYVKVYYTKQNLPDLLQKCDYIISVLPNTFETKGLLNADLLQNCEGKSPVFINIGRGGIIKEADLITALERKWFRAAALDVFETEPLPKNSKLWTMENVIITPHIAGPTRAKEVVELFSSNYQLFKGGKPLSLTVDFDKGY